MECSGVKGEEVSDRVEASRLGSGHRRASREPSASSELPAGVACGRGVRRWLTTCESQAQASRADELTSQRADGPTRPRQSAGAAADEPSRVEPGRVESSGRRAGSRAVTVLDGAVAAAQGDLGLGTWSGVQTGRRQAGRQAD